MRKITNNFFSNDVIVTGIYFFLILVGFISILEYRFIFDLAVPLYSISLILLVLVMFFGQEVNNHSSWLYNKLKKPKTYFFNNHNNNNSGIIDFDAGGYRHSFSLFILFFGFVKGRPFN